jgi:hypothetical protein
MRGPEFHVYDDVPGIDQIMHCDRLTLTNQSRTEHSNELVISSMSGESTETYN